MLKVEEPAMEAREDLARWFLRRLYKADKLLAEKGGEFSPPEGWWEPGTVWARGSERHGLHLAVFTAGVGIMASGDPDLGKRIVRDFRKEEGEHAGDWLAGIWRHIQGLVDDDGRQGHKE